MVQGTLDGRGRSASAGAEINDGVAPDGLVAERLMDDARGLRGRDHALYDRNPCGPETGQYALDAGAEEAWKPCMSKDISYLWQHDWDGETTAHCVASRETSAVACLIQVEPRTYQVWSSISKTCRRGTIESITQKLGRIQGHFWA